ncbi:MAG: cupin domain-containing protein [Polyangiaceae bacterium]
MSDPKYIVRQAESKAIRLKHPKNAKSEIWMTRLSDPAGLTRVGVNLGRIPAGKEAFVPHAHLHHEEWVFVVSGRGVTVIGDERHDIGPGDFLGFPCDGAVHHLVNEGEEDLVVLQGGERAGGDIAMFPTLGAIGVPLMNESCMVFVGDDSSERVPFGAWVADDD